MAYNNISLDYKSKNPLFLSEVLASTKKQRLIKTNSGIGLYRSKTFENPELLLLNNRFSKKRLTSLLPASHKLPPIEIPCSSKYATSDEKSFIDKGVGSCSPLPKLFASPTKIILAIAIPKKIAKNTYSMLNQSKSSAENKGFQMIKKSLKPEMFSNYKFNVLLCGNKMSLI